MLSMWVLNSHTWTSCARRQYASNSTSIALTTIPDILNLYCLLNCTVYWICTVHSIALSTEFVLSTQLRCLLNLYCPLNCAVYWICTVHSIVPIYWIRIDHEYHRTHTVSTHTVFKEREKQTFKLKLFLDLTFTFQRGLNQPGWFVPTNPMDSSRALWINKFHHLCMQLDNSISRNNRVENFDFKFCISSCDYELCVLIVWLDTSVCVY